MKTDTKWYKTMILKLGSEEAVTEFMRESQRRSMQNPNKQKGNYKGGFAMLDKATRTEISRNAANIRWARVKGGK